jgi:Uma2 family endonuclease
MAIAQRRLTLEELLALPEEEPALEYYDGTVTQKVSPQGQHTVLAQKCVTFLEQGSEIALLVDPDDELVIHFPRGASSQTLRGDDQIDLDGVLPGFRLTVRELFDSLRLD